MTSHNWNFRRGNEHSPLVKIILQLQAVEPDLKKYGTEIIPSSKEEKRRLSLQIRKAITYYKEMLILFSVYLKQDLSSKGRHEDMAHANKTYGSALRSLSRLSASLFGVDELDRNNAPATNLGRSSSGTSALTKSKAELANKRKDEKILQQQYFQLISRTIPDNYQTPSKSDAFKELPRSLRHERWLAQNHSWAVIRPELAAVFDEIVLIRKDIAELSGFDNYAELLRQKRPPGWPSYFVQAVSGPCRSLLRANHLQWKTKLGLSILRPYDMNISEMQGFNGLDEWIDKTKTLLQRIHPYFLKVFNAIISDGLYDILPHKGKSPEAICFQLPYTGRAFIFMSLSGTRKDIMTSIHELGHAIHIASAQETNKLGYDYQVNATTSEFFALAMELLALDNLGSFYYDTDSLAWAKKMHIDSILNLFMSFLTVHEFEEAIYSQTLSATEREQLFLSIISQNLGCIDYAGFEDDLGIWMYRIPLLVSFPGYFFHYAYAQIGALNFWGRIRNGGLNVENYISIMKETGSADIGVLYEKLNVTLDNNDIEAAIAILGEVNPPIRLS